MPEGNQMVSTSDIVSGKLRKIYGENIPCNDNYYD